MPELPSTATANKERIIRIENDMIHVKEDIKEVRKDVKEVIRDVADLKGDMKRNHAHTVIILAVLQLVLSVVLGGILSVVL